MYQPTEVVTSADALTEILGPCVASQAGKVIDRLDRHCRAWIARSPLVVVSSADAAGRHDVCAIARDFGGGGHRFAAGFTTQNMPLPKAVAAVHQRLANLVNKGR